MAADTKIRSIAGAVALLCVSILVGLLLAEALVRILSPQPVGNALPMYAPDEQLAHRLKAGFHGRLRTGEFSIMVRTNSFGFRGDAWDSLQSRKILVLGDSFTFGYGVHEAQAFPACLCVALEEIDCDVAVFNAGVPGYGTLQEEQLLERLWPRLRPDLVILAFTVGSDLRNNIEQRLRPEEGFEVREGYLVKRGLPAGSRLPLKAFFQQHSHLYVFLQRSRARAAMEQNVSAKERTACSHFLGAEPCGDMANAWEITRRALGRMNAYCFDRGTRFCLVAIPHPVQVYDRLWREETSTLDASREGLSREGVQQRLNMLAHDMAIAFIDPLTHFRLHATEVLYYPLDRHLTALGHQLVVDELVPVVAREIEYLERSELTNASSIPENVRE